MARMHKLLGTALIGLSLTGCVSQEKYASVKLRADQLAEQAGTSEADAKQSNARATALQEQLDRIGQNSGIKEGIAANMSTQLADLSAQNADLKRRLDDAIQKPAQIIEVGGAALPQPLTNTLNQFAAANSDIVDFDASRGVVKFKSDVTFAPGSTAVSDKARSVLSRFVQILDSPAAVGYDLMVAGHTDNTPIVRPETIKEGNFDNWYLSSHRAIAVAAQLVGDGVNKSRLGVAGYADQRPIARNDTEAGKAQNRRVEILILPTGGHGLPTGSAVTAAHRITHHVDLNKDSTSGGTGAQPIMNK